VILSPRRTGMKISGARAYGSCDPISKLQVLWPI
jgi:hypothetical protein